MSRAAFLAVLICLLPARAFAQADPNAPDASKVKVRLGPLMMNPVVTFHDIGTDENVFNEATDPKRDFSLTISPRTELYLRFMGTWFNGALNEDIVWYQKYASERQSNSTRELGWKWPLTRLKTSLQMSRTHTRERPGYEIDERAARSANTYSAAVSYKLFYATAVDFSMSRNSTSYDEGVTFKEVDLHDELSVVTDTTSVGVTHTLTPLTAVSASLNLSHDRYPFQLLRDTDTTDAKVGITFDPKALLKGSVRLGYTSFRPQSPRIPGYNGVTLTADMNFALHGVTRFTIRGDREVKNSYDIKQPYYLQTGVFLEVAQQLFGPRLDLVGRGGLEKLDYRNQEGVTVEVADRTDRVWTYGLGIGYHMGKNLRIGINYDQTRRESEIDAREYERPRVGTSVTYDF